MQVITIGRHPDNNVIISDSTVGRHHVQIIQHDDGRISLVDLNSTNGTFVNGKRVAREVFLKQGDVVQIGRTQLPWRSYFPSVTSSNDPNTLWTTLGITGGILGTILLFIVILCSQWNIHYYSKYNIHSQVLVSFADNVSVRTARLWLKISGAQILEESEVYNYYLVCTKNENTVNRFIKRMERNKRVNSVLRNQYLDIHATNLIIIDDFGDSKTAKKKDTHGYMVTYTMTKGVDAKYNRYNINIDGKISAKEMSSDFLSACEQMSDDNLNIVNISMGVSKYKDEEKQIEKTRSEYVDDAVRELVWYSDFTHKCKKDNFVITKSMGNEGEHNMEDVFIEALKKMDDKPEVRNALKDHIVLVAAKDTRKEMPKDYSNSITKKVYGINTIMVDISDLPTWQNGTSAAAPLFANWIAKSEFKKASDVIESVNKATIKGELVSENVFKETARKVIESHALSLSISQRPQGETNNSMHVSSNESHKKQSQSVPSQQPVTSSEHRGVSSSLVGSKWSFENGYSAERRSIEFTSSNKVRYTIEDINIWTDRDAPKIGTYNCYYDSSINRIIIERRSDMSIQYRKMKLRLEGNKLIEDTNPNIEIEYMKVR